jgi:hypothetical protein
MLSGGQRNSDSYNSQNPFYQKLSLFQKAWSGIKITGLALIGLPTAVVWGASVLLLRSAIYMTASLLGRSAFFLAGIFCVVGLVIDYSLINLLDLKQHTNDLQQYTHDFIEVVKGQAFFIFEQAVFVLSLGLFFVDFNSVNDEPDFKYEVVNFNEEGLPDELPENPSPKPKLKIFLNYDAPLMKELVDIGVIKYSDSQKKVSGENYEGNFKLVSYICKLIKKESLKLFHLKNNEPSLGQSIKK